MSEFWIDYLFQFLYSINCKFVVQENTIIMTFLTRNKIHSEALKQALLILFALVNFSIFAQKEKFTHEDSLRGSNTALRAWWDLKNYDLSVSIDPSKKHIFGVNKITYVVLKESKTMQIDLQSPMKIKKVTQNGHSLKFNEKGNAHLIELKMKQVLNDTNSIEIQFEGQPLISKNPPWSGGFTWDKDENGKDFIATSCQGIGASIWWPCKDHPADEPDNMQIHVSIPTALNLTAVANGRLENVEKNTNWTTFHWKVKNPINNYGVNVNIGDYVEFSEVFEGEKGPLDCQYYVLKNHLEEAKIQFKQVPMMLKAFEYWFGPYPFYEDSYKLVEVPYLGMEHQSSVTYGNGFKNGYLGKDLSKTGWGLKFDFIIIHESGHEWFANSITNQDVADMWIHESFTSYAENLYVEYYFGKEAGAEYVIGKQAKIKNDKPIIGNYNLNNEGSGDMYYKGENMLHTLRQWVRNDDRWRMILRKMNDTFYHQTVTSVQIEAFFAIETGFDLKPFFDQYLRNTTVPIFQYQIEKDNFKFRWDNCVQGFNLPLKVKINESEYWIEPSTEWRSVSLQKNIESVSVDQNLYIEIK
jgi:aminopeptidase N